MSKLKTSLVMGKHFACTLFYVIPVQFTQYASIHYDFTAFYTAVQIYIHCFTSSAFSSHSTLAYTTILQLFTQQFRYISTVLRHPCSVHTVRQHTLRFYSFLHSSLDTYPIFYVIRVQFTQYASIHYDCTAFYTAV